MAADSALRRGATEVCMQGGIDPDLPGNAYFDLAAEAKRRVPQMHVHAFSPMEWPTVLRVPDCPFATG